MLPHGKVQVAPMNGIPTQLHYDDINHKSAEFYDAVVLLFQPTDPQHCAVCDNWTTWCDLDFGVPICSPRCQFLIWEGFWEADRIAQSRSQPE